MTNEELDDVVEIMKKIDFCMLTTIGEDGSPHTRPMSNNREVEFDGDLWFFTYGDTHKALEIEKNRQVSVSFTELSNSTYLVLYGAARLIRDKAKIEELWKPQLKAWFPKGVEEPDIALIKVSVSRGELWQGPSNFLSKAWHFGKAVVTGEMMSGSEHKRFSA